MSKMPASNSIYTITIKSIIVMMLWFFSISYSTALVSIGALLETAVEKNTMDGTLKKMPWQAGVSSLFKQSLQIVKGRDMQVIDTSVKAVLWNIHKNYSACEQGWYLTENDIINILYYTAWYGSLGETNIQWNNGGYIRDRSFRRMIDQLIDDNTQFKVPTVAEKNASCIKLVQCQTNNTWWVQLTIDVQVSCENTVRQLYVDKMLTNRSLSLLTEGTFWENIFQNGSLEDSDYDLMVDIYNIWRIMFQWYTAPVELVYYQFPTPAQAWWSAQVQQFGTPLGRAGASVWPSAWPQPWNNTPGWFTNVGGILVPDTQTWWRPSIDNSTDIWSPDDLDASFINQTNTSLLWWSPTATSPQVNIGSNMCVFPTDPILAAADVIPETISYDEYQELLDEYYTTLQEQQIINNLIADEIAVNAPSYDPTDPNSINTYEEEIRILENEIAEKIDQIFDVTTPPDDPVINSCISDCDGLGAVDYAVCTAKCLCGEVWSAPIQVNNFQLIEANAFKIRFCQVPASSVPVTRWRSIYSIEEIFDEMRNIFVALRDSGELFKHVRTKEFLDSSIKRNNFGDMFAFNIFATIKGTQDNTPATQYKEELDIVNQKLEAALLNQASSMAPLNERNKYLLIANPTLTKAWLENDGTIDDFLRRVEQAEQMIEQAKPPLKKIDSLLLQQKTSIVNNAVIGFFASNFQFRDSVTNSFAEFNGIAENLKNKIQKAK